MNRVAGLLTSLLITTATLGGCDAKSDTSTVSPTDATAQPAVAPAETLALGDAKLFETDEPDDAVVLAADGSVSHGGELMGMLSTDGQMTLASGEVVMEVQPDGSVWAKGQRSGLTLSDAGGSVRMGEQTLTMVFNADGSVTVDPPGSPDAPTMAHEGCVGAMAKTCALVMFGMVSSEPSSEEPTADGEILEAAVEAAPPIAE